jgi:very-short-patch-repair endonuclease
MIRKSYRKNAKVEKISYARNMRVKPTETESILWEILKGKRLGVKFRRQSIIYGWIVDFYSPEIHLVIEIDGGYHNERIMQDKIRKNKISSIGVKVMRFKNEEIIKNPEIVLNKIIEYIENFKKSAV